MRKTMRLEPVPPLWVKPDHKHLGDMIRILAWIKICSREKRDHLAVLANRGIKTNQRETLIISTTRSIGQIPPIRAIRIDYKNVCDRTWKSSVIDNCRSIGWHRR